MFPIWNEHFLILKISFFILINNRLYRNKMFDALLSSIYCQSNEICVVICLWVSLKHIRRIFVFKIMIFSRIFESFMMSLNESIWWKNLQNTILTGMIFHPNILQLTLCILWAWQLLVRRLIFYFLIRLQVNIVAEGKMNKIQWALATWDHVRFILRPC